MEGNLGINRLALAIARRIREQAARPDQLELGAILDDMGLFIDRYQVAIPAGDYLVADWLARAELPQQSRVIKTVSPVNADGSDIGGSTVYSELTRVDVHAGEDADKIPNVHVNFKAELQPGDRVLVAWVNDGTDPVILCKVVAGGA